ncbi:hypothetical protein AXF42_Ash019579 [Apostasia shenzhenica]|uniref:Myb-like domain-containing protein n=1 Tax=Apostasia shenzhenica TaxID=1088818 RepID=A0A2I0AV46_9ASPA|nr:hypothetical protein AXF42_Ash019579 [Apostasia shenzhenica]
MSSEPSSIGPTALPILEHRRPPPAAGAPTSPSPSAALLTTREYRKGNWTIQETLLLITAKRLDDDRRTRAAGAGEASATPRSAEQRWKWVENYCWKHGCLRSQNQCNDKWDNLLRDYKKVRDYESRFAAGSSGVAGGDQPPSYWSLERHERKERNLPTNLALDVYDALADVLSRRASRRNSASGATPVPLHLPLPQPPPPLPPPPAPALPSLQASVSVETVPEESSDTEGSGGRDDAAPPPARKRRRGLGSSVVRGAAEIARTLMACEEKREQRHRDLMEMEERRLRMEEERTEMNRQAVAGLIAAVNGLSAAIHTLVADNRTGDGR